VKAEIIFREKRIIENILENGEFGLAEIKVWGVPISKHYPEGKKFSLFFVSYDVIPPRSG